MAGSSSFMRSVFRKTANYFIEIFASFRSLSAELFPYNNSYSPGVTDISPLLLSKNSKAAGPRVIVAMLVFPGASSILLNPLRGFQGPILISRFTNVYLYYLCTPSAATYW